MHPRNFCSYNVNAQTNLWISISTIVGRYFSYSLTLCVFKCWVVACLVI